MAEFTEGAGLMQTSKSPFTSEMNNTVNSLEFINNLISSSHHVHNDHNDHHNHHPYDHVLAPFSCSSSSSSISSHQHHYQQQQAQLQLPTVNLTDHLHQMSFVQADHHHESSGEAVHSLGFGGGDFTSHGSKKDKLSMPISSQLLFASPSASEIGLGIGDSNNKTSLGGKKRKRNNNVVEKPKEVVHVRAKRGQATDSHSLAERVRREKINQRLRCLQDLVPGCYKTMGMAVMLDVIINYVRSLQNQIEFLSMKLSAASMYNELNFLEMETMQTTDQGTDAYEAWTRGW